MLVPGQDSQVSSVTEKRRVTQPKLEVSSRPIHRHLNAVEAGSLRESLLLESFQILCYYLGNLLYTLLPTLE